MTKSDIPAGMRLKDLAGWNQMPEDWLRFLVASPEGCFAAEYEGRVVGTAATIVYEGRFAWIGMVLVEPEFRGRSIGTRLLEKTIEHLDACGIPTLKLDATPQGKPIYARLGFVSEYEIERWVLKHAAAKSGLPTSSPTDLDDVLALDGEIFGADRSKLLRSLAAAAPEFVIARRQGGNVTAYAFGRHGSRADHLGPWMAKDEPSAREILEEFLRRSTRKMIFVDCLKSNPWTHALLQARGFEFTRPLTRMYRGSNNFPGRPEMFCAILGPEFG
jgi:GNAT superfamily N-acetyltransferase